ncbi:hypothetical protein EV121DRAFT_192061 [Schizophyllum commune]
MQTLTTEGVIPSDSARLIRINNRPLKYFREVHTSLWGPSGPGRTTTAVSLQCWSYLDACPILPSPPIASLDFVGARHVKVDHSPAGVGDPERPLAAQTLPLIQPLYHERAYIAIRAEFCPPLEEQIVLALLHELQSDDNGRCIAPSPDQLDELRTNLRILSCGADDLQLNDDMARLQIPDEEDSCTSTPDMTSSNADTTSSGTSWESMSSSRDHSSSPLEFLSAALPGVSAERLAVMLASADDDDIDANMWDILERFLTQEHIRELEERGLDGLSDGEAQDDRSWHTVVNQKSVPDTFRASGSVQRTPTMPKPKKSAKNGSIKITFGDVRQQNGHRVPPISTSVPSSPSSSSDIWTKINSISSYLSTLLPDRPASFFLSHFHSPGHPTPYQALKAALERIAEDTTVGEDDDVALIEILEVLRSDKTRTIDEESRLVDDARLVLNASGGKADCALDLLYMLQDFAADDNMELGPYHSPLPSPLPSRVPRYSDAAAVTRSAPTTPARTAFPSGPPPVAPPPARWKGPSTPQSRKKPSPYQWQRVNGSKVKNKPAHPQPVHVPTYNRDVNGTKIRGSGNALGKGGKGDVGELDYQARQEESMRQRAEMLKNASLVWKDRSRGGAETALYYVERAREFQEIARKEALAHARHTVEAKMRASRDGRTLDLHGTTAAEAVVIVKDILERVGASPAKPVKIITGKGTHSLNRVSVLKPVVRKALLDEGWSVSSWDGGLAVNGQPHAPRVLG